MVGDKAAAVAHPRCVDSVLIDSVSSCDVIEKLECVSNIVCFGVWVALPHIFTSRIYCALWINYEHVWVVAGVGKTCERLCICTITSSASVC